MSRAWKRIIPVNEQTGICSDPSHLGPRAGKGEVDSQHSCSSHWSFRAWSSTTGKVMGQGRGGKMAGHQGGGAGRVNGDRWPSETKGVADATRGDREVSTWVDGDQREWVKRVRGRGILIIWVGIERKSMAFYFTLCVSSCHSPPPLSHQWHSRPALAHSSQGSAVRTPAARRRHRRPLHPRMALQRRQSLRW
jgi:hypothetical protein